MTSNAGSILAALLLALTAVATTTLPQGWDHWLKLDWSVESERP